jgi:hypothetical protein
MLTVYDSSIFPPMDENGIGRGIVEIVQTDKSVTSCEIDRYNATGEPPIMKYLVRWTGDVLSVEPEDLLEKIYPAHLQKFLFGRV